MSRSSDEIVRESGSDGGERAERVAGLPIDDRKMYRILHLEAGITANLGKWIVLTRPCRIRRTFASLDYMRGMIVVDCIAARIAASTIRKHLVKRIICARPAHGTQINYSRDSIVLRPRYIARRKFTAQKLCQSKAVKHKYFVQSTQSVPWRLPLAFVPASGGHACTAFPRLCHSHKRCPLNEN